MLTINFSNNATVLTDLVVESTTVKEFFDSHRIAFAGMMTANGMALQQSDLDKPLSTFADGGDVVEIVSTAKYQNA